jgi:arsenate reductase
MNDALRNFISSLTIETISDERKEALQPLTEFIQQKVNQDESVRLHFICTHNSRRSHLCQVWAQVMACHFKLRSVDCYSGGTERTALFPMIVETLIATGFQIDKLSEGENPIYAIKYAKNQHSIIGFSKLIESDFNPQSEFAAIMTCDSANEACPFVLGAEKRIPITYQDPKAFDNTPQQAEKYGERSLQIATEMFYVFSKIKF